MNMPDVDLYCLNISLPIKWSDGKPISYEQKSIGDILDSQDLFELVILGDWLSDQFLSYCDWDKTNIVTSEMVAKAFEAFAQLDIKPTSCTYIEKET